MLGGGSPPLLWLTLKFHRKALEYQSFLISQFSITFLVLLFLHKPKKYTKNLFCSVMKASFKVSCCFLVNLLIFPGRVTFTDCKGLLVNFISLYNRDPHALRMYRQAMKFQMSR